MASQRVEIIRRVESSLDFVKYANAYGARGGRVEKADGLAPTLEAAFKAGGVHLVTVPIDYSENIRVLIDELRQSVPADPQFKTD